jgi:RimJ/RimL family protein N-acetyltransferase
MIIHRYGIHLVRVQHEHIEMIRVWRNDPKIREHMFFKSEITPEMQQRWYQSISNDQNFYFLVCPVENQPAGLISLSSIDYEHSKAFAGLFIYDDNYIGTDVPVRTSLCLLDVFFSYSNIHTLYAKVRNDNVVADHYNSSLGFERIKKIELGTGYEYELTHDRYFQTAHTLRQAAMKLYGSRTEISFNNDLLEIDLRERFLEVVKQSISTPSGMSDLIIS